MFDIEKKRLTEKNNYNLDSDTSVSIINSSLIAKQFLCYSFINLLSLKADIDI